MVLMVKLTGQRAWVRQNLTLDWLTTALAGGQAMSEEQIVE